MWTARPRLYGTLWTYRTGLTHLSSHSIDRLVGAHAMHLSELLSIQMSPATSTNHARQVFFAAAATRRREFIVVVVVVHGFELSYDGYEIGRGHVRGTGTISPEQVGVDPRRHRSD